MLKKYSRFISKLPHKADNAEPMKELFLWKNTQRKLECFYAPFDYVNQDAKIIVVGITPGKTQMNRALNAARAEMVSGGGLSEAIRRVKREGSLSGKMRPKIVDILNRIGYQKSLGIDCSNSLWNTHNHLVHFCSLLKYPVFKKGGNYNGDPKPLNVPELSLQIHQGFVKDLQSINSDAILLPLGEKVADVITKLDGDGLIPQKLIKINGKIVAPPHPSGANAESIALFLEENYVSEEEYLETMYQKYIREKPWLKNNGRKSLSEDQYKRARSSRWKSMLFVRQAYGIQ